MRSGKIKTVATSPDAVGYGAFPLVGVLPCLADAMKWSKASEMGELEEKAELGATRGIALWAIYLAGPFVSAAEALETKLRGRRDATSRECTLTGVHTRRSRRKPAAPAMGRRRTLRNRRASTSTDLFPAAAHEARATGPFMNPVPGAAVP